MNRHPFTIPMLALALAACAQTSQPAARPSTPAPAGQTQADPGTQSQPAKAKKKLLGLVELAVGPGARLPDAAPAPGELGALAYVGDPGIAFTGLSFTTVDDLAAGRRYYNSTYAIKNVGAAPYANLTFYAHHNSTNGVGGTAISRIVNASGQPITDPAIARAILGSHGMVAAGSGSGVAVDPSRADFQAFRPSEAQAIESAARAAGVVTAAADDTLEYGYVVRNAGGGRGLAPGETGQVTLALSLPVRTVEETPHRFSIRVEIADEPVSRVSRGPGETTAQAVARAGAPVNAAELALVGTDEDVAGGLLRTVRLPSVRTFSVPNIPTGIFGNAGGVLLVDGAYLEVPQGAVEPGTRFALERLGAPPSPLPAPFVSVGQYRLYSSATTFKKPLTLIVPVDVPTDAAPETVKTELKQWDGLAYDTVRIGDVGNAFLMELRSLPASGGNAEYAAGSVFVAARATVDQLRTACEGRGGTFNGDYCQEPPPGGAGGQSLVGPQSLVGSRKYKVMSFNAGSGVPAGSGNELLYCGGYVYKLCSRADEARARNAIAAYNPDIIALQETWHDDCTNVNEPVSVVRAVPPGLSTLPPGFNLPLYRSNTDRMCAFPRPVGRQMQRLLPSGQYVYKCIARQPQPGAVTKNGYECIAVRSLWFEFVTTAASSVQIGAECDSQGDTGFQLETVKAKLVLGVENRSFEIVNAHLKAPLGDIGGVRECQLTKLEEQYRPRTERSIVLGDFNIDTIGSIYSLQKYDALVEPQTTPVTADPPSGSTRLWYQMDENTFTAQVGVLTPTSLDHVLSNFASGTCVRGAPIQGFDHLSTRCDIAGFHTSLVATYTEYFDTSSANLGYRNLETIPRVTRRGIKLDNIKFTFVGTNYRLYVPDGDQQKVFFEPTCTIQSQPSNLTRVVDVNTGAPTLNLGSLRVTAIYYSCG